MAEKQEIITIYDFTLKTNTLYEVTEKYDANAPTGYRKLETTKALMEDIYNQETVAVFNEDLSIWDTGLYEESILLKRAVTDPSARKVALSKIKEHIIDPIEAVKGANSLRPSEDNNKFWDNFSTTIFKGKVFNTAEPLQLLQLYIFLLKKSLTPTECVSHPDFKKSQYCILDKELVIDKENEKALRTTKGYGLYWSLKTSSKPSLLAVMNYLNLTVDEKTSDSSLDLIFKRFIEHPKEGLFNLKEFIQVSEDYSTKEGKNVINIYQKLKELYKDGLVELRGKEVYIDGNYIASSFKSAANVINQDKEAKKIFTSKLQ